MKKLLLTLSVCAGIMSVHAQEEIYQLQNSGFEDWEPVNYEKISGEEPVHWNSFITGIGDLKGTAAANQLMKSEETRPGTDGSYSAKLIDRAVKLGFITLAYAQGNMTTGCVSMNSTSATDANGNFNFSDINNNDFNQPFTGRPDAMKVWVKYHTTNSAFKAKANTILHTSGYYQDPEGNAITATVVAKAEKTDIESNGDWQELTIPFSYSSNENPSYALVSFATNATPGKGTGNDYMLVDDLEYLYYSELASLNYDGKDYFTPGTQNYTINDIYDKSKLSCTSNGKGATIATTYNEETAILTITVKGNDVNINPDNIHTYTIQFAKPQPVITEYENDLLVSLNEQGLPNQKAKIQLIQELDGTTSLALNNFILGSGSEAIPVGNIKLTNLEVKDGKIQATQDIYITAGDDPAYEEGDWLGPLLSTMGTITVNLDATILPDNQMEAIIEIPDFMGLNIKVNFAKTQTYTDGNVLNFINGLTNIVYNRTFPAGWNTICLPFATTTAAFGEGVKAQAFISADNNGLNFGEVTELEANKPYLIYFKEAKETPTYFGTEITSTTPVSVTFGDFTFCGSYEDSISMAGKYGVADQGNVQKLMLGGEGSTLKATRAYFTKSGDQPAMININLDGNATGIENIEQNQADIYDIYNLQGQLIRKNATSLNGLAKGIYIVNGKKVMVK